MDDWLEKRFKGQREAVRWLLVDCTSLRAIKKSYFADQLKMLPNLVDVEDKKLYSGRFYNAPRELREDILDFCWEVTGRYMYTYESSSDTEDSSP
jgi:hypothetical protein